MSSNIKVSIQPRHYPSKDDFCFVIPLAEPMLRDSFQPIHRPSFDADFATKLICEVECPEAKRETITIDRKRLAGLMQNLIEKEIFKWLSGGDTTNGYTKDQDKDFYGREIYHTTGS